MGRKIATCCYCGTRAVLVLDKGRHELSCSACGAPLHSMKMMPQAPADKARTAPSTPSDPAGRRRGRPVAPRPEWKDAPDPRRRKPRSGKRRKPVLGRLLDEIWDVVEDIID